MDETVIMHYWDFMAKSPCGREVRSAYWTAGHGYTSSWDGVDCPECLTHKK